MAAANDDFPDPGMPLMAIMSREDSGMSRNLSKWTKSQYHDTTLLCMTLSVISKDLRDHSGARKRDKMRVPHVFFTNLSTCFSISNQTDQLRLSNFHGRKIFASLDNSHRPFYEFSFIVSQNS
jgi:hypothetical protein